MKKFVFVGVDSKNRAVYRDESGTLWKSANGSSITSCLYSVVGNEFEGEPGTPLQGGYEIVSICPVCGKEIDPEWHDHADEGGGS